MDTKLIATAAMQSQNYTDSEVAKLRTQMNEMQAHGYRGRKSGSTIKIVTHFICIAVGLAGSCLLIKFQVNEYLAVTVPGVPSFMMEVVDKIKML
jgi:hypothetical protein